MMTIMLTKAKTMIKPSLRRAMNKQSMCIYSYADSKTGVLLTRNQSVTILQNNIHQKSSSQSID